jgi:hypothetical protein
MTQTLYAHMYKIKIKKKRLHWEKPIWDKFALIEMNFTPSVRSMKEAYLKV